MKNQDRRESFNFRLLELKDPFYDHIEAKSISRSKALRHFVKQGLTGSGMSIEQQEQLRQELIELKRSHAGIGRNLNQIARYFNTHGHLIESDLHQTTRQLADNQKAITQLLNALLKLLGG